MVSDSWAAVVGRPSSVDGRSASSLPRPAAPLLPRSSAPTPTAVVRHPSAAGNGVTGAATLADAALADGVLADVAAPAIVLVGERGANLRRGPGPEYPVVATLRAGARLELRAVSPTGEWYQVRLPGRGSPWIDARYGVIIGGVGGLPGGLPIATGAPVTTNGSAATHPPATPPGPRPATAEPTPTRRPATTATPPLIPASTPVATAPPP